MQADVEMSICPILGKLGDGYGWITVTKLPGTVDIFKLIIDYSRTTTKTGCK